MHDVGPGIEELGSFAALPSAEFLTLAARVNGLPVPLRGQKLTGWQLCNLCGGLLVDKVLPADRPVLHWLIDLYGAQLRERLQHYDTDPLAPAPIGLAFADWETVIPMGLGEDAKAYSITRYGEVLPARAVVGITIDFCSAPKLFAE
jgi:hypothetical protein